MTPKAPVEPADLRKRVTIQSVSVAGDDEGGRGAETWSDAATVWAQATDGTGTAADVAGSPNARRTVVVRIRFRSDVRPNGWRFRLGSRTLNVEATEDEDGLGRILKCTCREVA